MATFDDIWDIIGPQQNRTKCPEWRAYNGYTAFKNTTELEGDCVELGVWKGGISAMFGKLCEDEGKGRKVWAFDSYQGMSPYCEHDIAEGESRVGLAAQPGVQLHNFDLGDFNKTCFDMMGLKQETVTPVKGWVDDTLPVMAPSIDKINVLRIDLDWYEPTKVALEHLYDKVQVGGYIICDDYGYWKGARKAIDEYRELHGITSPIIMTPMRDGTPQPNIKQGTEHYWIKEK